MLEVLREHFSWSDEQTFQQIQLLHGELLQILRSKGIDYDELRTALTPQQGKQEVAFIFDAERCDRPGSYGKESGERVLSLLDSKTTHSILSGDLRDDQDIFSRKLLEDSAIVATDLNFRHPCFAYVIYVNNLSDAAIAKIDAGLKGHKSYLAYVPCTHSSRVKTLISLSVSARFIKHKRTIVIGHEDDRSNTEDFNLHFYEFEKLGLTFRSLQSNYFGIFLSYKIERMFLETSDEDLEIALRAMSIEPVPLVDFSVLIEDSKFHQYLQTKKRGKLEKAGIAELTKVQLEEAIRLKLRSNYIYNMEWVDEPTHKLSKFNIMLEFPREGGYPERLVVALEYKPEKKVLRLLTVT